VSSVDDVDDVDEEVTERTVLYSLVSAGFMVVVAVLIVGAAAAGVAPQWWTAMSAMIWVVCAVAGGLRWKRTRFVLSASILVFVIWTVGTLLVAR
jgi:hypothetical protein